MILFNQHVVSVLIQIGLAFQSKAEVATGDTVSFFPTDYQSASLWRNFQQTAEEINH